MDIVLNGICKRFVSYRKCLGKSSTYKRTSVNGVVHRKKFSDFCRGGEGGRSVGPSCGGIRPSEKAKLEKRGNAPLPATKKKELVVSIRQDSGANQQRKLPTMPTRLPPTLINLAYQATICYSPLLSRPQLQGQS